MDSLPTVKVIQPAADLKSRDACLITHVTGEASSAAQLDVTIDASFLTVPIAQGVVIQTECHVGTTGARFELLSQEASVRSVTQPTDIATAYENKKEWSAGGSLAPTVSAKTQGASLELSGVATTSATTDSRAVAYAGREPLLAVTTVGESGIRWSLRSHRGERAVADYLEGTLTLSAAASWTISCEPALVVTAQPTDIRFFSPSGARLNRMASLGLWLKLKSLGVHLPSREPTEHRVRISFDSGG